MAFDAFTRAYNDMNDDRHEILDRRLFERMFIIYAVTEYQLFMGEGQPFMNECTAFFPRNVFSDFDKFIMAQYDQLYEQFVSFWGSHSSFRRCKSKSINENDCSTTIVCDGHMKIRRRLCANPNISHKVPAYCSTIFKDFLVGCCHSPAVGSMLCDECKNSGVEIPPRTKALTKKQRVSIQRYKKRQHKTRINDMASVRCTTTLFQIFLYMEQ